MKKFKKNPVCEECGKEPATSFSFFQDKPQGKRWSFCGGCTSETETYYIEFENFFRSPASTVDWLAHLHEKDMDWQDFMSMIHRFREATDSFNAR